MGAFIGEIIMRLTLTRESNAEAWGVNVNDTINIHPETYLLGCVPSEMNGPDEAVKAQAIAARTNAYTIKNMTDNSAKH
jgi:peptidoglycan hydrolase-like amidase